MLPRILPGDLAIARRQHAVEEGEIAVAAWPEQEAATLRRVHHFDRHLVLAADNPFRQGGRGPLRTGRGPGAGLAQSVKISG
jgi:SOS-response transcriptional repressor LexA